MIPREFVDMLDKLIRTRIEQSKPHCTSYGSLQANEQSELIKRDLTDYLMSIDTTIH